MGPDGKWSQWGSADLQLYSQRRVAGSCLLLGHWAAVSTVMRSICLCFLPAVTLTASVDCCCNHPPPPTRKKSKRPGTQQLNKITQISHVDHGKHFQLRNPGQMQLAKVTCMILGLHSKAYLLNHVPLSMELQQLCQFTFYMKHMKALMDEQNTWKRM